MILNGHIDFLLQITKNNKNLLKGNLLFNNLFECVVSPNNFCYDYLHVNVFTCGSNDQMSLGNPLGTSKRQKILFKGCKNFVTRKVCY